MGNPDGHDDLCGMTIDPETGGGGEWYNFFGIGSDNDTEERQRAIDEVCDFANDILEAQQESAGIAYNCGESIRRNVDVLVQADEYFREQIKNPYAELPWSANVNFENSFFSYGYLGSDDDPGANSDGGIPDGGPFDDSDYFVFNGEQYLDDGDSDYGVNPGRDIISGERGIFDNYSGDDNDLIALKTDANFLLFCLYHQISLFHSRPELTPGQLENLSARGDVDVYNVLVGLSHEMGGEEYNKGFDWRNISLNHPYRHMFVYGNAPPDREARAATVATHGSMAPINPPDDTAFAPYYDPLFNWEDNPYRGGTAFIRNDAVAAQVSLGLGDTGFQVQDGQNHTRKFTIAELSTRFQEVSQRFAALNSPAGNAYAIVFNDLATNIADPASRIIECIDELHEATRDVRSIYNRMEEELEEMEEGARDWLNDTILINALGNIEDYIDDNYNTAEGIAAIEFDQDPKRVFFKEQCLLLSYLDYFVEYRQDKNQAAAALNRAGVPNAPTTSEQRSVMDALEVDFERIRAAREAEEANSQTLADLSLIKRLPYYTGNPDGWFGNASCEVDGDPYAFINALTMDSRQSTYFNIDNDKLAYLQPKLRLFKCVTDPDTGIETDVEFKFDTHFSENEMRIFTERGQRAAGVGLKSFEFTYDGSNPFSAKKSIKGTLKIHAASFDDLLQCRGSNCITRDDDGTRRPIGRDELGDPRDSYKFVDLALKTYSDTQGEPDEDCDEIPIRERISRENDELAKLNFRLKAVVGVSVPLHHAFQNMTTSEYNELGRALNANTVTLNLTPTIHNFDFDETGRVTFTINYLAFVDDFYDDKAFNIFANSRVTQVRMERESRFKEAQSVCSRDDESSSERLDEIKEENALAAQREFKLAFSTIINNLLLKDKIRYIEITNEDVMKFTSGGPYHSSRQEWDPYEKLVIQSGGQHHQNLTDSVQESLEAMEDAIADDETDSQEVSAEVSVALMAENPENQNLSFFYVSDLVDIILENIETELTELPEALRTGNFAGVSAEAGALADCFKAAKADQLERYYRAFKKLRVVLGPVEITSVHSTEPTVYVNFGDIPISVKYFVEWMSMKFFNRASYVYSLSSFLMDLFNNLVDRFLNSDKCFGYSVKQKIRMNQAVITGNGLEPDGNAVGDVLDAFTEYCFDNAVVRTDIRTIPLANRPILRTAGYSTESAVSVINTQNEVNYFIFFAGQVVPSDRMNGVKEEDEEMGIFHYMIGRDKGLIKKIDLSKASTPGLAEVRFEQEGYDGLQQLRVVYDAKITTFSNVNTFPGTYLYIEPLGWSPSARDYDLTQYGLGGYYMIIRTKHLFRAGKAESVIECKWVNQLEGEAATDAQERTSADARNRGACTAASESYFGQDEIQTGRGERIQRVN